MSNSLQFLWSPVESKKELLTLTQSGLFVSCQALPHEPLYSSFIMGRMALAAALGGASGIRANTVSDIQEIKRKVSLPLIGIIKKVYPNSDVFITPTLEEAEALCRERVDIVAMDATKRDRPKESLKDLMRILKTKYPNQVFMADVSTFSEAERALEYGFDIIAPTLLGYTSYTENLHITQNNYEIINKMCSLGSIVIAEGNIGNPSVAQKCIEAGAHAVVVGSSITRPQIITENFLKYIKNN